jgi:predicted porin
MQKKLLTMAVAGALAVPAIAVAQNTTEVYGTVNMSFGQFRYGEGTNTPFGDNTAIPGSPTLSASGAVLNQQPSISKWDVNSGGSNFGVRSRENLGGGLAGWVQIETGTSMERSDDASVSPGSRNTAVGMQGGFGNIFMGQWTTPWADLDSLWSVGTVYTSGPVTAIIGRRETTGTAPNPNATNNANGLAVAGASNATEAAGGVGHPFWRRFSQAIFYQSPVMAGVQVKLAYQTNESKANGNTTTNADPSAYSASVQWAGMGGRARIGAGYDRHKDFTSVGASDTGYTVKGGWNFGVVDVGLAYETMKYKCLTQSFINTPAGATLGTNFSQLPALCGSEGDIKAKQYAVAIAVPVGPGSIRASYAVAKDLEGAIGCNSTQNLAASLGTCPGGALGEKISNTGAKQYNIGYEHRFSKRTNVGVGYAKIDNKANANFTWSGSPPNQQGVSLTPLFGSDVSTFFVSMTHRF